MNWYSLGRITHWPRMCFRLNTARGCLRMHKDGKHKDRNTTTLELSSKSFARARFVFVKELLARKWIFPVSYWPQRMHCALAVG